jgi:excinuclease ABC subunit C
VIADGGKGQIEAIRQIIVDELGLDIPVAGLAKDNRHRTSELITSDGSVIGLKQNTPLFRLMSHIQDEVHRFAITFHRNKRSKRQTLSELDNIKSIGEKSKQKLMQRFKSVKRLKEAELSEIETVVGKAKAEIIHRELNKDAK